MTQVSRIPLLHLVRQILMRSEPRIEREWQAEQAAQADRAREFEPQTVAHLLDYPRTATASLSFGSVSIGGALAQFCNEAQINQVPEFLRPLEALPASLQRIGDILARGERSAAIEQQLREEIGKLQARVAGLEAELAKARNDLELQKKPWFGKLALLGGAIVATCQVGWLVSGDDLGPKKRCEKITEYWEFFGGGPLVCEMPVADTVRPSLPKSFDT